MERPYTILVVHPATMAFERTPFEGDRREMLELAEELQEIALGKEERVIYFVRPLPLAAPPEERRSKPS